MSALSPTSQPPEAVQVPKRRGAELVLIVLALTISVAAYAIVGLSVTARRT